MYARYQPVASTTDVRVRPTISRVVGTAILRAFLCAIVSSPAWSSDDEGESPLTVAGAETISVDVAARWHAAGAPFIDVRNPRLYTRRHVPGAIHLDLYDEYNKNALLQHVALDQPFVIYCSGVRCSRSSTAAEFAIDWGFTRVKYFRDGIVGWRDADLPMTEAE